MGGRSNHTSVESRSGWTQLGAGASANDLVESFADLSAPSCFLAATNDSALATHHLPHPPVNNPDPRLESSPAAAHERAAPPTGPGQQTSRSAPTSAPLLGLRYSPTSRGYGQVNLGSLPSFRRVPTTDSDSSDGRSVEPKDHSSFSSPSPSFPLSLLGSTSSQAVPYEVSAPAALALPASATPSPTLAFAPPLDLPLQPTVPRHPMEIPEVPRDFDPASASYVIPPRPEGEDARSKVEIWWIWWDSETPSWRRVHVTLPFLVAWMRWIIWRDLGLRPDGYDLGVTVVMHHHSRLKIHRSLPHAHSFDHLFKRLPDIDHLFTLGTRGLGCNAFGLLDLPAMRRSSTIHCTKALGRGSTLVFSPSSLADALKAVLIEDGLLLPNGEVLRPPLAPREHMISDEAVDTTVCVGEEVREDEGRHEGSPALRGGGGAEGIRRANGHVYHEDHQRRRGGGETFSDLLCVYFSPSSTPCSPLTSDLRQWSASTKSSSMISRSTRTL